MKMFNNVHSVYKPIEFEKILSVLIIFYVVYYFYKRFSSKRQGAGNSVLAIYKPDGLVIIGKKYNGAIKYNPVFLSENGNFNQKICEVVSDNSSNACAYFYETCYINDKSAGLTIYTSGGTENVLYTIFINTEFTKKVVGICVINNLNTRKQPQGANNCIENKMMRHMETMKIPDLSNLDLVWNSL